jgi:hypothetical protein
MDPFNIANYVITMMHDGHSRDVALHSAVIEYDLGDDDEKYQKVLKELEPMEREYKAGLAP